MAMFYRAPKSHVRDFQLVRFSTDREEDLVQRVNDGDQSAIEDLFDIYYDGLCKFVRRLTNSKDDVEDLVQDIFVRIWVNREDWSPKGSIKAYLFRSARNQAFNFLKSKNSIETIKCDGSELLTPRSDPAEKVIDTEISERIDKAIEKLPHRTKLVFTLNRQDGLSYSEIADVLEISMKTVENQIARALRHLRKELANLIK